MERLGHKKPSPGDALAAGQEKQLDELEDEKIVIV